MSSLTLFPGDASEFDSGAAFGLLSWQAAKIAAGKYDVWASLQDTNHVPAMRQPSERHRQPLTPTACAGAHHVDRNESRHQHAAHRSAVRGQRCVAVGGRWAVVQLVHRRPHREQRADGDGLPFLESDPVPVHGQRRPRRAPQHDQCRRRRRHRDSAERRQRRRAHTHLADRAPDHRCPGDRRRARDRPHRLSVQLGARRVGPRLAVRRG